MTEKNLKKARRKIKNKISAQESRKRKRDYVNNLEERLADFTSENMRLKQDLEKERTEKKSLVSQVSFLSRFGLVQIGPDFATAMSARLFSISREFNVIMQSGFVAHSLSYFLKSRR